MLPIRIIVGGPPNSGKSTFSERLVRALQDQGVDAETIDLDIWSPTLDFIKGDITMDERNRQKRQDVTEKDAKAAAKRFRDFSKKHDVIIGDAPGGISELSKIIVNKGTHGIIVCRDDKTDEIESWKQFFEENDVELVAIVYTSMEGEEDISQNELIEAKLVNLNREAIITPAIIAFATLLREKLKV